MFPLALPPKWNSFHPFDNHLYIRNMLDASWQFYGTFSQGILVSWCQKSRPNSPGHLLPRAWGKNKTVLGTDFELWPNISLQCNIISTIGNKFVNLQGFPFMPPNCVNFGPETAENGCRVLDNHPKFSHWKTTECRAGSRWALPHISRFLISTGNFNCPAKSRRRLLCPPIVILQLYSAVETWLRPSIHSSILSAICYNILLLVL